jgi:hypothetical protein
VDSVYGATDNTVRMFETLSSQAVTTIYIVLALVIPMGIARNAGGLTLTFSPLLAVLLMQLIVTREGYRSQTGRRPP